MSTTAWILTWALTAGTPPGSEELCLVDETLAVDGNAATLRVCAEVLARRHDPALAGTRLRFDLAPGLSLTGLIDRSGPGGLSDRVWAGRLVDRPGWFVLVVNENLVLGELSAPDTGHFHIRPAGPELPAVRRVDPAARLRCLSGPEHVVGGAFDPAPPPDGAANAGAAGGACGVTVDVMFVWTADAQAVIGGQAATEALVDSYVEYTNQVYAESGVEHRFRLVHGQLVDYDETTNILTDLARLKNPSDGFLDDVHPLRDEWGADLVALVADSPSAGVAYAMAELSVDFEDSAFSVMAADPGVLDGGIVFAHESGHNMGCHHNNTANPPDAIFCYSYGHQTPDEQWRTILSYGDGAYVDFFSSPDLEFGGWPLGVSGDGCPPDAAHNVRSLNEAASTVAQFRPTVVPLPCPDVNGDGVVDVDDLTLVVLAWGPCPDPPQPCPGDVNGDQVVDVDDLVAVVLSWS